MESSQDKNLPATGQRLQRARDDGQVARSQYLPHLAMMVGAALLMHDWMPRVSDDLGAQLKSHLAFDASTIDHPEIMLDRLQDMLVAGMTAWLPIALSLALAGVLASVAVSGLLLSFKPLEPDFSRINPLSGLGRMFSREKLLQVGQILLVVSVLASVVIVYVHGHLAEMSGLGLQTDAQALRSAADWLFPGLGRMLLILGLVAMLDVPAQIFLHKARLKMSSQEVTQEHKESEGSPEIKSRRRARQRELAMQKSIRHVPKADFVLVNPTHYTVALRYDEKSMAAPQVVAKGADLLALRMRDVARAHDVPLLESPALARALYAHAELDREIPSALFAAVAQVLAYVYMLRAAARGERSAPKSFAAPEVPRELDPNTKAAGALSAA